MTIPLKRDSATRFCEDYRHYMAEVPRFIPRRGRATGIAGAQT